ncbi:7tm Odorant receptor [Popillia japonica]|uniref:7tm Odorant receptor n=1 Tax=Popillia japonica TaxID=7064 RepID=A0AAW1HWW1_POPJA
MFKSSSIIDACYLSKWYELCHPSQKTFQLIMERAKHPVQVELKWYELCHPSQKTFQLIMERAKHPVQVELYQYVSISLESLGVGERDLANILTIVVYASVTFAQIAIYHWLGNEVIFMSSNIVEACYLSKWYNINTKAQKSLLLLMERAKRPLVIEVYKLIFISLESLAVVCSHWIPVLSTK